MTENEPPGDFDNTKTLTEWRLRIAEGHITELEARCARLADDIAAMRREAAERERNRLKWGVAALGATVSVLCGVIWSQIKGRLFP